MIYGPSGLFGRLLIPNVFGQGSISCMPLTSCSLTWPALLLFFYSAYYSLYSTVKGQMQIFKLKDKKENLSLLWRIFSWSPISITVKNYTSGCCVFLHQTDSEACHLLSHPYCFLQCLLSSFFPFSSLLPHCKFPLKITRQVFSCLAVRRNESPQAGKV